MGRTLYTIEGLAKLGEIVRTARGNKSVRKFGREVGISHATITRLENGEVKEPEVTTLQKLATHVGYTKEELIAICESSPRKPEIRMHRLAEDVLPAIKQLPDTEAAKVAQAIIARLVKPKVSLDSESCVGVTHQPALMNQNQLAQLLRAIADKLESSLGEQAEE